MSERGFKKENRGSDFDEFLKDEGILDHCEAVAAKRVLAFQIQEEMKALRMTKSSFAKEMKTSRAAVDRILDPNNVSVTLQTIEKAAVALGKKLTLKLA